MPRTDTAFRVIAAPPEQVYAALVDREALEAWLPPDGMTGRFERFDVRPGGSYRLVLSYADAAVAAGKATFDSDIVEVRYVDVDPDVRVVQAVDFVSDDPGFAGTMTMTWEVTSVDGGTRVDITAADVPVGICAEDHAAGLASSLPISLTTSSGSYPLRRAAEEPAFADTDERVSVAGLSDTRRAVCWCDLDDLAVLMLRGAVVQRPRRKLRHDGRNASPSIVGRVGVVVVVTIGSR